MIKYIITCEHAGNKIPGEYSGLFHGSGGLLQTHRGYDIGIFDVFKSFNDEFNYPSFYSLNSRLLIDLNRSLNNRNLFSSFTRQLDKENRDRIITLYYKPLRDKVEQKIASFIKEGYKVYHIAFHSFTPVLNEQVRNADIGFLYDPKSKYEKTFCLEWKNELLKIDSILKIRFNYPYLGTADGFTTYLRRKFDGKSYAGIELEINQKLLSEKGAFVTHLLINSFKNLNR